MITVAGGMESDSDSDDGLMLVSGGSETSTPRSFNDGYDRRIPSNGVYARPVSRSRDDGRYQARGSNDFWPQNRNGNYRPRRRCFDSKSSQAYEDLRYAILQGHLDTVKAIFFKGIQVDTVLKGGWTSLMYACAAGYPDIVSYLLEIGADPNYGRNMFTPLMAVCAAKKTEKDLLDCCCLLLQSGAQVDAHERHLMTPLMFAAREGYVNIAKELLERGACPDLQDNNGRTALAWAASRGHGQIVRLLIEKGADIDILTNMGENAADLASQQDHKQIVSLLQKGPLLQQSSSSEDCADSAMATSNSISKSIPPTEPKHYKVYNELELFLSGIGLLDLMPLFVEHQLAFNDLLIMDDSELEKIGIHQVGVRKKILANCKSVHKQKWQNSSVHNLKTYTYISCADAVAMMANIAKHLKYISASVIYVRQQIQSQPRILELSQDSANVHNLLDEMDDTLKNVHFLNDELRFLKMHLEKVQDQVQFIPADLIVETVPIGQRRKRLFIFAVGIAAFSAVITGLVWKKPDIVGTLSTAVRVRVPFFMNNS